MNEESRPKTAPENPAVAAGFITKGSVNASQRGAKEVRRPAGTDDALRRLDDVGIADTNGAGGDL